jgi:type II secretory pathway component GspD/PulD (secretin)
MVGENVPFPTGQIQSAATGGNIQTQINRQDVGIKLELTPQITSDDNVRLEIKQEISDVTVTPGINPNILGPTTSKRAADTTVVVKDRQTVVIGGLIRDNVTSTTSKVPLLGDIPILGWLFKYKTSKTEKTNLMIFITPYVIKNENDAYDITKAKGEGLEKFRKEYGIEKKSFQPTMLTPTESKELTKGGRTDEQPALESAPTATAGISSAPSGSAPSAPSNEGGMTGTPSGAAPAPPGAQPLETGPTGTQAGAPAEDLR